MSKAQNDEPCAFAKLWGQLDGLPFHCYMTNLPSTLGRGSNATAGSRKPPGFIDLGQSKALSREHATISWVPEQKTYQITCLSKNGMVVSGSYHAKGGVEKLESRTPIKLGPASMYFLLPEKVSQRPSAPAAATVVSVPHHTAPSPGQPRAEQGAKQASQAPVAAATTVSFESMVREAFRSPALSAAAGTSGLSSGDVHNWIMQNYPEWNQEGARMRTLAVGIESVLKKNFSPSGGDRWTDPTLGPSAKRLKLANDAPVAAPPAQGAAASSQWAANMTGSGDSGRQANGGGVASAVDRAGMGEDDGGGIDVGMDG